MRHHASLFWILLFTAIPSSAQTLPTDEADTIEYLRSKEVTIRQDSEGHAVRLMSTGKPTLSPAEYQLIGRLTHLEQVGLNGAPLAEGEWRFLKSLPKLKSLSIWHGHGFATFSGLPVESLTIGGCMGLRDLNRGHAEKLRHVIKTLHNLPHLRRASLYHSPLSPDDSHLVHLATHFPKLEDLRLDFAAPRGSETTITQQGLQHLQTLPLKQLCVENAGTFQSEHLAAIAGIDTLQVLLVDARRTPVPIKAIDTFKRLRPDVEVAVANSDAKGPPRAKGR